MSTTTMAAESRSSQELKHYFNINHESQLQHAIQHLLHESRLGAADIQSQKSNFLSLFQSSLHPSSELLWIIIALTSHSLTSDNKTPSHHISAIQSTLHTIISYCDGVNIVVLLSIVLFELHSVMISIRKSELGNRLFGKVESVLDRVLGYIGLCSRVSTFCCMTSFVDLVRVCMRDEVWWSVDEVECLKVFFPFVSCNVVEVLEERMFDVGYLAGIVATGAFFMKLCLMCDCGMQGAELVKDLGVWTVCFISTCPFHIFFEILVRILLEPTLPVTHIMRHEGEVFLRKILYDAVVFPEYSFLKSDAAVDCFDVLPVLRLLIAHKAMEFYRENGDYAKVISYAKAFSSSTVPSQLTKLVQGRLGSEMKATTPDGSSTTAYLEWLVDFEKGGASVIEDKYLKEAAISLVEGGRRRACGGAHNTEMFFVDKKGEEDGGSPNSAFITASRDIISDDFSRKRRKVSGERCPKYASCGLYDPEEISGGSQSEVDDPGSD